MPANWTGPARSVGRIAFVGLAAFGLLAPATQGQAAKDEPKAKAKAKAATKKAAPTKPPLPPTAENVAYGDHPREKLDFYKAESATPTPLVVFIHGGGWVNGDKYTVSAAMVRKLNAAGISVAAINYRYTTQADEAGVKPPVKWPIEDAVRALQFLRSKAGEWNIDKTRIAATGGSAGACSSLYLAFHDDLAKPDSPDPIARESTRLACAAVTGAQTTLDPKPLREWIPNYRYGGHAFGFRNGGESGRDSQFQVFLDHRDEVLPLIKEYSPMEHAGAGDPPIFLDYPAQKKPPVFGENQDDPTHSAVMALPLVEKLKAAGDEVHLMYPGHDDPDYPSIADFLIAKLKAPAAK